VGKGKGKGKLWEKWDAKKEGHVLNKLIKKNVTKASQEGEDGKKKKTCVGDRGGLKGKKEERSRGRKGNKIQLRTTTKDKGSSGKGKRETGGKG